MTQIADYNDGLQYLFAYEESRKYIDDESLINLPWCCANKDRNTGTMTWKMKISEENPFKVKIKGHQAITEIEISLYIEAEEAEYLKIRRFNVQLKLWSDKVDHWYRPEFDSTQIPQKVTDRGLQKRVMLRFHYDIRKKKVFSPEPYFHFHVGGRQSLDENCWIPRAIKEPRIPSPPLDIVLLLEYIFVNYYSKETEQLRSTPK